MMNKTKFYAALCALIFAVGAAGSIYAAHSEKDVSDTVEIVQDGVVVKKLDLAKIKEKQTFSVEYEGRTNTIEVSEGRIRAVKAQCPDKICVKRGYLAKDGLPIVCLPNHLIIRYAENGALDSTAE